ncbi:MAG: ATP-binding protein [Bacteroidales bacterium]|nr:ATP-binding protein [Bacteroidales bacterium]
MESLFERHDIYMDDVPMQHVRSMMETIDWESRLILIKGPKGVGKSTLLKQFVKLNYAEGDRHVLYCSADTGYFASHSLVDVAMRFHQIGGKRLIIDEVHKFPNWSQEIKEIYDLYSDMRIILSGSSLIQLNSGEGDLSRRIITYNMPGLSLREYILFATGLQLEKISLDELLVNPTAFCSRIRKNIRPLEYFIQYIKVGYYPFYFEREREYTLKVEGVINHIVENELVRFRNVDLGNTRKLKALLHVISEMVPYEVEIAKLSRAIGIKRDTVLKYMEYLDEARLTTRLYANLDTITELQKPDKLYLDNSNLLYVLSSITPQIGTVRETFFANQLLSAGHRVEYAGYKSGDFRIDNHYVIEVGGAEKGFGQIEGIEHSYVAADDIESALDRKIPLWAFGFLY